MLLSYLRTRIWGAAGLGLACVIFAVVFALCKLPVAAVGYAALLCLFFLLIFTVFDFLAFRRRHLRLQQLCTELETAMDHLPETVGQIEADYQELLACLQREHQRQESGLHRQYSDMMDYYTTWVHQIKTPIAVMKLYLAEETLEHRAMAAELFRMEQYVDMVLQYLRLGGGENDLVIEEYKLDELIRETVRKFAAQFVLRKLRLTYVPTEKTIVTDRKWFCCILEQLLSNAIKYTPEGGVTVAVEGDKLYISDTGIGIAPEDLPRIFEKGYTGQNGRLERSASGLGLYLTRRAAELLHIPVTAESRLGQGTTFTLHLEQK